MSTIHARFWVQKVTKQAAAGDGLTREVTLQPKIRPDGNDNVDWSKYTPSGSISLNITNDAAGAEFDANIGNDVAITFEFIPRPE